MGWLKKHKKELLLGAGLLGLGATGFGLAGMGPMAGLLGGAAAPAAEGGLGLLALETGPGAAAGGLAGSSVLPAAYGGELASVGEAGGTMLGGASPTSATVLPGDWGKELDWLSRAKGLNWDKGMKGLQMANNFTQQGQPARPAPAPMPQASQMAMMSNKELAELYKRLYGGLYV